jgi:DNA polymerase-3 subunit alpha
MLENKLTLGLFQIEDGHAARRIAKDMEARSLEDLGAIVALNRPGPLRSGMVDRYFLRRADVEPVTYHHEILEDILDETYGDFLYQEAVLAYFRAIGYTLGEADEMRSILGKKKVEKMHAEHPRYIERAMAAGLTEKQAETIWNEIVDFSKYSFNKSHAISYGKVLLWTMWMKFHYPTEFILASIQTVQDKGVERVGAYVNEGRRMGVNILGPDINHSDVFTSKVDDNILFGLSAVKGVNDTAADWIIANRPYESFDDLISKLDVQNKAHLKMPADTRPAKSPKQLCGRGALNALLNAGAFDALHDGEYLFCEKRDVPQVRDPSKTVKKDVVDACDKQRRAEMEKELTGIVFQDLYSDIIESNAESVADCCTVEDVQLASVGSKVRCYAVVSEVNRRRLKEGGYNGGETFAQASLGWGGATLQAVAWPGTLKKYQHLLKPGVLGVFDIEVKDRGLTLLGGSRLT